MVFKAIPQYTATGSANTICPADQWSREQIVSICTQHSIEFTITIGAWGSKFFQFSESDYQKFSKIIQQLFDNT